MGSLHTEQTQVKLGQLGPVFPGTFSACLQQSTAAATCAKQLLAHKTPRNTKPGVVGKKQRGVTPACCLPASVATQPS